MPFGMRFGSKRRKKAACKPREGLQAVLMMKGWRLAALVLTDFLFQLLLAVAVFFADAGHAVAALIAVAQPLQLIVADAAVVTAKAQ